MSIALLAGLLMTRLFKPFKLPSVTAYLIAGVLIGPYCIGSFGIPGLGFDSEEAVGALSVISEVALGFIAFSIGNEFRVSDLKKTGRQALVIGVVQALVATLLVDLCLFGVHLLIPDKLTMPQVITLGAIATATAPAATLMVVRQYKAKGPLTKLLLPIVALDDAVGLVVFAVSFGIAKTMVSGNLDLISILVNPLIEIACSLVLGAMLGINTTGTAVQLQHQSSQPHHWCRVSDCGAVDAGFPHRPGARSVLVAAGLHDAGHDLLQHLPVVARPDGGFG